MRKAVHSTSERVFRLTCNRLWEKKQPRVQLGVKQLTDESDANRAASDSILDVISSSREKKSEK